MAERRDAASKAEPTDEFGSARLAVNGKASGMVHARDIKGKMPLSSLLIGDAAEQNNWTSLRVAGAKGARMNALKAGEQFRGQSVSIYLTESGDLALGSFRRPTPSMSEAVRKQLEKPGSSIRGVRSIEVWTTERPRPAPTVLSGLTISYGDAKAGAKISAQELKALPVQSAAKLKGADDKAGSQKRQKKAGWHLRDVVALHTPPQGVVAVELASSSGETLSISAEKLLSPTTLVLLRHNRRGQLSLDLTDVGGPQASMRLRQVVSMSLQLRAE